MEKRVSQMAVSLIANNSTALRLQRVSAALPTLHTLQKRLAQLHDGGISQRRHGTQSCHDARKLLARLTVLDARVGAGPRWDDRLIT
jgi:hypothetical protein